MTTSIAAGWLIALGGFTGLVGMQLVFVRGSRPHGRACPQRARREAAAAQLQRSAASGVRLIPPAGGSGVGPQRVADEVVPTS